jgi:GNAT superfamily N-acetyltransferase
MNCCRGTIYIREADSDDIPLLSGLIRDSFRDVAERFSLTPENCPKHPSNCDPEWIESDFARGVTYYILEHNGTPTGCVALEKASPDLCYLERLAVLEQNRRQGFGRALVDHVFAEAKALGTQQIGIGIIAADTELKFWYQKIGFTEEETKELEHLPFLVTFMTYQL